MNTNFTNNQQSRIFTFLGMFLLTVFFQFSGHAQSSCPKPITFSTTCTSGISQCSATSGSCSYTTSFSTNFTGNNKYVSIIIYANGSQVHQQCLGPLSSGTRTYSVSYSATCGATISGSYVAYTNSSGPNPCGGTTCSSGSCSNGQCGETLLPITLVSFDAKLENNQVVLEWITSSEQNNDHFRLEKSRNGIDWSGLYTMMGAGNTVEQTTYEAMDHFPFSGQNYYRLVQVDYDGTENISGIVSLDLDILESPFKIENNGNSLKISDRFTDPVGVALIDMQGRVILNDRMTPGSIRQLEGMINGIYVVRLHSPEIIHSQKIAINR